ncbi:MAG: hypothetical protein NZM25_10630 [Leptospiraceae bacterium]|nr:hypothetical protein [Leptospiraceae bacterium]MDW8305883.1 hypothetical protein [Leptospiraceae bacterium]
MGRWGMRDDFTLDGKVSYEEYSLVVVVFALSYLLAHALIAGFRRDELKDWRIRIEKAEPEIPRLKDMVTPRHIEIVEKTFLQKKSSRRKGRLQADSNDISRGEST